MDRPCGHLENLSEADFAPLKTPMGCEECLKEGTKWVALRQCMTCGHVGCCDSSPGKHATKHYFQTQHPVMRSAMPGDKWTWCYEHEAMGELAPASSATKKKSQRHG